MAKRKRKTGANLDALDRAAKQAAARPKARDVYVSLGPVVVRDLEPTLSAVSRRPHIEYSWVPKPPIPEVLKKTPRQLPLRPTTPRKLTPLRATTTKALGEPQKQRRSKERMSEAMREAICGEYRRSVDKRRQSMFAKGSAGKGRRNTGKRTPDWRAKYC